MSSLAIFLRKPHFAVALTLLSFVAAVLAYVRAPIALFPSVVRPAISVSCTYPGANALEVVNTVAGPIEEKINGVEGMSRMTSSCSDSGAYSLTVYFNIGIDRDMALTKVQGKVQQALSLLPQEVKNTGVTVESGSTEELGILTLRSPSGKLTREQMVDYAYGVVNPAILRAPGIGSSTVKDNKIAMRVWLDTNKMASHGISTEEIVSAIKSQNVQASLGSVGASPTAAPECRIISLISKGRLNSAAEFERIIVRTNADGGLVRLGDVARVQRGQQGYAYEALYDEMPAVYIRIVKLPGIDVRKTINAIRAEMKRLESTFPGDLAWDMTYDSTLYIDGAINNLVFALVLAALLALVIAGFGLRSLRGALLVAITAAVPMAMAFAALVLAGCFVSIVSLYALIVAAGLSVAVMTLALACPHRSSAVIAAMLAIAAAMLPLALIDGMQGVMYGHFSLVVGVTALGAALSATCIVPPFAALFGMCRDDSPRPTATRTVWLSGWCIAVVFLACGIVACGLRSCIRREFIPSEDMGVVIIDCKTAEGTSMPATAEVMRSIYRKVRDLGGVSKSVTLLGESNVSGSGENNAKMYLTLDDWSLRDTSMDEIVRRIKLAVADVPEAVVYTLCPPPMPGQGTQNGICELIYSIDETNPVNFANEAQRYLAALSKSPLAASANCGVIADVPHLRVHVDRDKCELLKVPMLSLYTTLQHALGSVYVNDINLGTQVNRVTVMSDWQGRSSTDRIGELYVRSQTGDMVPVNTLATFSEEIGVRDCYRCNQYLYCTIQYMPKPGVATSEAIAEIERISAATLPHGYLQDWGGLIYERFQSRDDAVLMIVFSILAIYLVLMVFSGSFVRPIIWLLPTTSAVLGASLLHLLLDVPMSLYSQFALMMTVVLCAAISAMSRSTDRFLIRALPGVLLAVIAIPLFFMSGPASVGSQSFGVTLLGGFAFFAIAQAVFRCDS